MKPIFLLTSLLLVVAPRSSVARAPSKEDRFTKAIAKRARHIKNTKARKAYARRYAKRILLESKRRNLDPVAMTAVAWIESDFKESAKRTEGNGVASYGVWQIIPSGFSYSLIRKTLGGCKPPPKLKQWRVYWWKRRMRAKGAKCESQAVANRRIKSGKLNPKELRDHILATYIAHYEMSIHIKMSYKLRDRPRRIRGCKLPRKIQYVLYRMARFNSGMQKPRRYYLWRLCKRYGILNKEINPQKAQW